MRPRQKESALLMTPLRSEWKRLFDKYDEDKDGYISYVELREIIKSNNYECDLPPNVVKKIMRLADQDHSGNLDFDEFVAMMQNPDLKAVFGRYVTKCVLTIVPPRGPVDTTDTHRRAYTTHSDAEYEDLLKWWPPPVCMILISLLEIVFFCVDAAKGYTRANGPVALQLVYNPHKRHEAWRFLTYMLAHDGWLHLIPNVIVQLILGVSLEVVHRWWRVMPVYIAGVALGSLAFSLTNPRDYLAGASAGGYALHVAHVATIIMNWSEMENPFIKLFIFLLLLAGNIVPGVYDSYSNPDDKTGHLVHVAGAVAGLLVGIGVLRNLEQRKWEKRLWWAAVLLYCAIMISGILANIFWTSRFYSS